MSKNVVAAKFSAMRYFKIPIGLDLEDKKIVKAWEVYRWEVLCIEYVDGREERIDCCIEGDDTYIDGVEIIDAEDGGMEYLFEEDEEVEGGGIGWAAL